MAAGWQKFKGKSPYPELGTNPQRSQFTYGVKKDRHYRLPWVSFITFIMFTMVRPKTCIFKYSKI